MVDSLGETRSESNHVRHFHRIHTEDVIDLTLRQVYQSVGSDERVSAVERLFRGLHVFSVGRKQECY